MPIKPKTPTIPGSVSRKIGKAVGTGSNCSSPVVKTSQVPQVGALGGSLLAQVQNLESERLAWMKSQEKKLTKEMTSDLLSLFKKSQDMLLKVVDENTRLAASLDVYKEMVQRPEPTSYAGAAKQPPSPPASAAPSKAVKKTVPKVPRESSCMISLRDTSSKLKPEELKKKILSVVKPREKKLKLNKIRVDEQKQTAVVRTSDRQTLECLLKDQTINAQAKVVEVPERPPSLIVYNVPK